MKRILLTVLVCAALAASACTDKQSAPPAPAAQAKTGESQAQPAPAQNSAAQQQPAQPGPAVQPGAPGAANPHANVNPHGMAMRPDHKGKVVTALNTSGYTYIEVDENGKKLWVAAMKVDVKPGDEVVFPDSPPVENFQSKSLNRTFDRLILAPAIQVNGKMSEMGAHPKTN